MFRTSGFHPRHPRLFNPTSSFNTFRTVLAHVSFIGLACGALCFSMSCGFQLFSRKGLRSMSVLMLQLSILPGEGSAAPRCRFLGVRVRPERWMLSMSGERGQCAE